MKERSDDAPKGRALTMSAHEESYIRATWPLNGSTDGAKLIRELDAARVRLAAREAECADLLGMLREANHAFNVWARDEDGIHPEVWPFVERLRGRISRPSGDYAALRAIVAQAVDMAAARVSGPGQMLDANECAAIVARLLPPATQAQP